MINHFKTEEYWLVFYTSNDWYANYLKEGYSHCAVITKDEFNWILLDPLKFGFRVHILPHAGSDPFPEWMVKKYNVLKITKYLNTKKFKSFPLSLPNCVTQAQYIINLSVNVLTPYGLYSKLTNLSLPKMKKLGVISVEHLKG